MKIIILGAGQVGGTLAENLVGENNDITLVDTNPLRSRTNLIYVLFRGTVHILAYCAKQGQKMPTCWLP